jgi:hypothetical protein
MEPSRWEMIVAGLERWSPDLRVDGPVIALTLTGEDDLPAINRYLVEQGANVYALAPQTLSLEDLFIQIVGNQGDVLGSPRSGVVRMSTLVEAGSPEERR